MQIERVIIKNYRCLKSLDVKLNKGMNIIVGDNEAGKSTFIEAIHLALTGQLYGRNAIYELHPYLFHRGVVTRYLASLQTNTPEAPPEILIELHFADDPALAERKGDNNSTKSDCPGVCLAIKFNDDHRLDYQRYIAQPDKVTTLPIEYYKIEWHGFDGSVVSPNKRPLRSVVVDASTIRNNSLATKYISEIIQDFPSKERVDLSLAYRGMRSSFLQDERVQAINDALAAKQIGMSDKKLSMSLDATSKTSWETGILPHLDDIPMPLVGKGEQNSVKIRLAIHSATATNVLLVEEPENHLSHGNLGRIIEDIKRGAQDRQIVITSHSSFVINKLGVDAVLLFANSTFLRLNELSQDTRDYFMKLPGYDTLRLILSKRCILVEGPSDELIVQKAYTCKHQRPPQSDGIDVISVRALAFKRFLEIAREVKIPVTVITDNDGRPDKVKKKYASYDSDPNIKVCYSDDPDLRTLEPHMVAANGVDVLSKIFGKVFSTSAEVEEYMTDDKTGWALQLFETQEPVSFPPYIDAAVRDVLQ